MKKEITNISLSFCCKKDWNTFKSIDEQSRFCGSCKHRVVDFTKATAEDFARAQQHDEKICGRFTVSQMSTAFLNSMAATAFVYSTVVSCNEPLTTITSRTEQSEDVLMGVVIMEPVEMDPAILMGVPVLPAKRHGTIKIVNDSGEEIAIVPMGGLDEMSQDSR